jgi:aspartate/methionine/tyrosine aminotransferase
MELSYRARNVEPFHAMAFGQHAAALEAAGHDVVRLNLGEPDFGAPPAVREAMREAMDGRPLAYTAALGTPELRAAIAGYYRDVHSTTVDPARIAITSGASAALLLAVAATVDPGDDVIMADPSYPCNRELVRTFGGHVVAVPTTSESRFQLDRAAVERAWTPQTRAVMVASPSNPTGTSVPFDELSAICEFTRDRGRWRIVDEIYLDLADQTSDGSRPRTVLAADPDAIVINSFSKYFGMTGWRLGWAVLPEILVTPVERLAMNYFLCASSPAQLAALSCFTTESLAECERRREELVARREVVLAGLEAIGLPVPARPDGAFYVYVDVSATGLGSWEFCQRALQESHVALTPGRDFGTHSADAHVRLSYASSLAQIEEGLRRLAGFVAGLPGSAA